MNLTRCNQGHFYDADKYSACPHCEGASGPQQKTVASDSVLPNKQDTVPPTATVNNAPQRKSAPAPAPAPSSLKSEVDDVQKTVGIFNVEKGERQPVAGWLVCVEGPHFGQDFRIEMGRNFVGRAQTMDIVLDKDQSISREKHAIIVYEPKGNMFIIQSGDSKELFYLNDRVVLSPTEMKPYDNLKIGSSILLFVPFCSDSFNWNDLKDAKEEDK